VVFTTLVLTADILTLGLIYQKVKSIKPATLEEQLKAAATAAEESVTKTGNPAVDGTKIHTAFEKLVNAFGLSNVKTEQSFLGGVVVKRGTAGSVRPDVVVLAADGSVVTVYDLKTGAAILTDSRITQIQKAIGSIVPVLPIKP
jgi:hypothetical protein